MIRTFAYIAILAAGLLFAQGCGGGSKPGTPVVSTNRIVINAAWPVEIIEVKSLLIEVFGLEGRPGAAVLNNLEPQYSFTDIPVGGYHYTITAFSGIDATGTNLGMIDSWLQVTGKTATTLTINPDSSATLVSILIKTPRVTPSLLMYEEMPLTVEGYDGKERLLPLRDNSITWDSSKPEIAEVSAAGIVSGKKVGASIIGAADARYGRRTQVTLSVDVKKMRNPVDGAEMVYIPACDFTLGDNEMHAMLGEQGNCPEVQVKLNGYYIYRDEVTVRQYKAFCDSNPSDAYVMPVCPWSKDGVKYSWDDIPDHPIVNVTWLGALAYARWAGGTLPSEAQWERAAQGGPGKGTRYAWGDAEPYLDDMLGLRCRYQQNADRGPLVGVQTAPIEYYNEGFSPESLYDLAGNVWEWCYDPFANGAYATMAGKTDPINTLSEAAFADCNVIRGGSFNSLAYFCRSSYRFYAYWNFGYNYVGFRCVVPVTE